jgi:hypothetical protein
VHLGCLQSITGDGCCYTNLMSCAPGSEFSNLVRVNVLITECALAVQFSQVRKFCLVRRRHVDNQWRAVQLVLLSEQASCVCVCDCHSNKHVLRVEPKSVSIAIQTTCVACRVKERANSHSYKHPVCMYVCMYVHMTQSQVVLKYQASKQKSNDIDMTE